MKIRIPKSVSGQIANYLELSGHPVATGEVASTFGITHRVASAILHQIRKRGDIRQASPATIGRMGTEATWEME